jgi:hypothetical protein
MTPTAHECEAHAREIREIKTTLFGNGQPGIKTTLAVMDERLTAVEAWQTKSEKRAEQIWWMLAGTGLATLASLGVALFQVLFEHRVYPG